MANNSTRKSIEFLVEGALPPHSTNVLWMDTSNPELPVLKIFKNGVWTPVTTDNNKTIQLLVEHITSLQEEITNLEEGIQATCDSIEGKVDDITLDLEGVATEENATANRLDIKGAGSKNTFDCHTCIPAVDWQDYSQLVLNDGDYAIGNWAEDMDSPDTIEEGTVVHAENVDTTTPVVLIKKTQSEAIIYVTGDAEDGWTLPPNSISEVIRIESGKNYICTGSVTLMKIRPGQMPLTGSLYLWSEYEGKSIYDAIEEIKENINGNTEAIIEEVQNAAVSTETLQSLADSWAAMVTNRSSVNGITFIDDGVTDDMYGVLLRPDRIKEIDITISAPYTRIPTTSMYLEKVTIRNLVTLEGGLAYASNRPNQVLTEINLPDLESIPSRDLMQSMSNLSVFNAPKLKTISSSGAIFIRLGLEELNLPEVTYFLGTNSFMSMPNLKRILMPKLQQLNGNNFQSNDNLIDFVTGEHMTTSFSLYGWSPTNALSSTSTSLVDEGETFTSNLEKLLYNIREHIAANLPDRTGLSALTITFSAAVKAAILADTDTANAFADKNWTVS